MNRLEDFLLQLRTSTHDNECMSTRQATPIILRVRIQSEPCSACSAAPGKPCHDSLGPVSWTHTRGRT